MEILEYPHSVIYYECHITVEPVLNERLVILKGIAERLGFKLANLVKVNEPVEGKDQFRRDQFMTAHSHPSGIEELCDRMKLLVTRLQTARYEVHRFKIEGVVLDSREYKPSGG